MESINRDRRATRDDNDDDDGEIASSPFDSCIYPMDSTFGGKIRFVLLFGFRFLHVFLL